MLVSPPSRKLPVTDTLLTLPHSAVMRTQSLPNASESCCGRIHAPVYEVIADGYWGGTVGDPNCVWMPGGAIIARTVEVIPRNEAAAVGPDAVSSRVDEFVVGNGHRTRRTVDRGEATRGRIAGESTVCHGQIGPGVVLPDSERTCRSVESAILDGVVSTTTTT